MTDKAPTGEQRVFDDVLSHPRSTCVQIAQRLEMRVDLVAHALRRSPHLWVRERMTPSQDVSRSNPYVYAVVPSAARPQDRRGKRKPKATTSPELLNA